MSEQKDTEREEIQANIDSLNVEIEKLQAILDRETERMALLPQPNRRIFKG